MWIWYCPEGGLEHRTLLVVGWRVLHRLNVDGIPWVKLGKSEVNRQSLNILN